MKLLRFIFLIFSLIANLLSAVAYNFSRLDNTNGLSNNQVEYIYKDSRGFMWFATNYGLNRYDGYDFVLYKSILGDSASIPYNAVRDIREDVHGNLWFKGNPYYTVYDYRTERFIRNISLLLQPMGLPADPTLVEFNKEKDYYLYYPDDGIYFYSVKERECKRYQQNSGSNSLSGGNILGIKPDGDYCWALFENGLLERFNLKSGQVDFRSDYVCKNKESAVIAKNIFIDSDGNPWIYPGFSDKGVLFLDMKTQKWTVIDRKFHPNVHSDFVRSVCEDKEGRIWIATDHGGVNIFDKKTNHIHVLKHNPQNPNSISQNSTISIYCDDIGTVWIGTYKNGVSYYHPQMFKFEKPPVAFFNDQSLEIKDCNALLEDGNGNLWIGTNGEGLIRYNKHTQSFQVFKHNPNDPNSISSNIIISLLEDHEGKMWFGTFFGGLNRLEGNRFVRYLPDPNNSNSLSNKSVYKLIEDQNHNIWIATLGGGINQLDPSRKKFKHFTMSNSQQNYILSMFTKDSRSIYLCTASGVNILDTETCRIRPCFSNNEEMEALTAGTVCNAIIDRNGQLWLATDNGIVIYNSEKDKASCLLSADGLPGEQVSSLVEDEEGKIWAGTRNGLCCITPVKQDGKVVYSIVSFDEKDGLLSPICNPNAIFKTKDGHIYIGCTKGYAYFDPLSIPFNSHVPQSRFTTLEIGNQIIRPTEKYQNKVILDQSITCLDQLELDYNKNSFSIHFSAFNFIHPEKNKYRYRLEGFDQEWMNTKKGQNSASYSNLNPGNYRLIVYSCNNDDLWAEEPIVLPIVIHPPFWLSWWAYSIYSFLILGFLFFVMRFLLKRQRAKFEHTKRIIEARQLHEIDEMKFRFFTNISHEFRTPLTLIINPIEKLLHEAHTSEEKNLLGIIQNNALSLLELVNQLLDFRRLDVQKEQLNISMGDIVAYIKDICYSFSDWANKKNINLTFTTAILELQMEFDKEKIRKIIRNLLSNAFKFTSSGGKIDINLSLVYQVSSNDRLLKIVVSDTGIGISNQHKDRIFERFYRIENPGLSSQSGTGVGLHLVSEYVKLHKGEVSVESQEGKGSTFTVTFPVNEYVHEEVIVQNHGEINKQDEKPLLPVYKTEEGDRNDGLSKPLLLVADDNDDFRNFIAILFKQSFRIITAADGVAAYDLVLNHLPDLIISDIMMPKMDGLEFCRLVKDDIRTSHIPVILLTAKASDESKVSGLEAGADDYIAKPFNMEMLKLKVSQLIEHQRKIHEKFRNRIDISPSEVSIMPMDEKFVKKAVCIVENNICNPDFSVEDLSREVGMSRVYFYKKILSLTAKTPSEFIRFIRLKRVAGLLEKSQLYVNEVAFQTGFNDLKLFRKYFKDEFGVTPTEYKKRFEN
ncbi:MAG: response regulator [Dysgonamonadaceae bacterium]|jgi:signal transduction histidine kinase/ligand-binding sensor domain-containing protein/DNA-binding response OmpR family regulator|nr:response regulator [Dysgonamonadaceae bacterium]